jgi:ribose transport system permease protein
LTLFSPDQYRIEQPLGILSYGSVYYTFAIGSNIEAARLSGIKTRPWLTAVYTFCGLCSGLAGIMYAAVYTSIIPSTGNGLELLGIAGVVIGGTSMSGGTGTLIGTIIGVFIMSVLKQGLMSMGLQAHWQTFFTGIVVILAVLLDQWRIRQSGRIRRA